MKKRTVTRFSRLESTIRRVRGAAILLAFGSVFFLAPAAHGADIPEWPHDREERLSVVESQLLDVQRELFAARMANDEAKREKLEKRKKELEREEVKLLRASGQFPPR